MYSIALSFCIYTRKSLTGCSDKRIGRCYTTTQSSTRYIAISTRCCCAFDRRILPRRFHADSLDNARTAMPDRQRHPTLRRKHTTCGHSTTSSNSLSLPLRGGISHSPALFAKRQAVARLQSFTLMRTRGIIAYMCVCVYARARRVIFKSAERVARMRLKHETPG